MDQTKAEILASSPDQHTAVQRSLPKQNLRKVLNISGGDQMFVKDNEKRIKNEEGLTIAVYNWLRYVKFFSSATLNFIDTIPSNVTTTNYVQWEVRPDGQMTWDVHPDRKMFLAKHISTIMYKYRGIYSIEIKKDGITIKGDPTGAFGPNAKGWKPHVAFDINPKSVGQYQIKI